jgi:NADH-quinone oxidoreductase subunit J
VLFLILCFVNAAGLFMLAGAEFLALILVVVYVGAVAVLFLFVVMMLDVDFASDCERACCNTRRLVGAWSAWCCCSSSCSSGAPSWSRRKSPGTQVAADPACRQWTTRASSRPDALYTHYVYLFQGAGAVLLVAMIGAIVLTLRHKPQRQAPGSCRPQVGRTPKDRTVRRSSRSRAVRAL